MCYCYITLIYKKELTLIDICHFGLASRDFNALEQVKGKKISEEKILWLQVQ